MRLFIEKLIKYRKVFWPIEPHESKKFIAMTMLMFCILLNYSVLRSIKDGFIINSVGAEALGFLKLYLVLPAAVAAMLVYSKLCNITSQSRIFYIITVFFLIYIICFTFILYPNPAFFHPSPYKINYLVEQFPRLQWFIKISGYWSYASFYVIAELWGSVMLSLLFWQFANKITDTKEAKRFYPMFGLLGNFSLPTASIVLMLLRDDVTIVNCDIKYIPVFIILIFSVICILFLYKLINSYILEETKVNNSNILSPQAKKKKVKLSLKDSLSTLFRSKYLGLLTILVVSYGVSINLVEAMWKSKLSEIYTTKESYTMFMGNFQAYQGITTIIFMIIGSNILRKVSWKISAILTPIVILITGGLFFLLIIFDDSLGLYVAAFFTTSPLMLAAIIGTVQNVFSKSTKYSLFDSTKEMAYIPLSEELRTKGKAAVDVVGGRLGKSGGGMIQSTFFILFPNFTFLDASPYFALIFTCIVIVWILAVNTISIEYNNKLSEIL
ncbi:Npt1/Npt2 family nucleotide transporter [Rickettsia endosymbiont of Cardiosporidium cionae]|uniref:Npt1/Npt2 family nucleotide transporter n=1 Tax=Rickettsia endosymbiont of Cardiosporidium cionae TaxID=2777155 RepID=UPI0018950B86|nr:Npt1/Npt2 family nucleotide transporter [Rickettsia endosymbiont of Cardiosporidium cionae]